MQNARVMEDILEQICRIMETNAALKKEVRYRVNEVGRPEKAQLESLLKLTTIDPGTKLLLSQERSTWMRDPSSFWCREPLGQDLSLIPAAQIVRFFIQRSTDDV